MSSFWHDWSTDMDQMQREMERLLGDFATRKPPPIQFSPKVWEPAMDIYETDDELVIHVELPGVKENEINLVVDKNVLIIHGERKEPKQESKRSYHQMEIVWGPFERAVQLPFPVDFSKIRASYEDGILEVILPKAKGEKARKIEVKTP